MFELRTGKTERYNDDLLFEADFPGNLADTIISVRGILIEDNTDVEIRFPCAIASCPRAESPDAGCGEVLAYPRCKQVKNMAISVSHHTASSTCARKFL
jgi:hypothetical protein